MIASRMSSTDLQELSGRKVAGIRVIAEVGHDARFAKTHTLEAEAAL